MSKFNPDFWEVVVDRARLEAFATGEGLWRPEDDVGSEREHQLSREKQQVLSQIHELIRTELTPRQQEVVHLYYFAGLTEARIAERLGIPQQVVSQHLHGILRQGKRVGGAMPRLRKLCEKHGMRWNPAAQEAGGDTE